MFDLILALIKAERLRFSWLVRDAVYIITKYSVYKNDLIKLSFKKYFCSFSGNVCSRHCQSVD